MKDEERINQTEVPKETAQKGSQGTPPPLAPLPARVPSHQREEKRGRKKNLRRGGKREGRSRSEFDHKIVSVRRVTRVMAGGRRFSFSVTLVVGNRKGAVGVGAGKAADTSLAIEKALRDAKKNMITVNVTKEMSIPHETEAKFGAARVKIMPAPGRGILAGSSVRAVLGLAGLTSINAKILSGSKNPVNNAKAAVKALAAISRTIKR
ncbi:30S ribosomal protein S5 [Patescibacteria group bacterium]|nr:MAG: 30S ribosomal protein S5 [Patescibacteria group bacterium]